MVRLENAYKRYDEAIDILNKLYDTEVTDDSMSDAINNAKVVVEDAKKELESAERNEYEVSELCNPTPPQSWPKGYGTFN